MLIDGNSSEELFACLPVGIWAAQKINSQALTLYTPVALQSFPGCFQIRRVREVAADSTAIGKICGANTGYYRCKTAGYKLISVSLGDGL